MDKKVSILVEDLIQAQIVIDDEYGMKASEQDFKGRSFPLIIEYRYNKRRGHFWSLQSINKYDPNKHINFEQWTENK